MRLEKKVYITRDETKPNVMMVHGRVTSSVREAVIAIQWMIHNLRLSGEDDAALFLAQERLSPGDKRVVRVLVGSRPSVDQADEALATAPDNEHIVTGLWEQLGPRLADKAHVLMGCGKDLHMRFNFGRLNIRRKEKKNGDEFTHEEFQTLLRPYGVRGNGYLGKR